MKPIIFLVAFALLAAPGHAQTAPDKQKQDALQRLEKTLRDTMNWCEITDKATQDAVVACAVQEETALGPVREAHRKVAQSLTNKETREAQLAALLNDWRAAVEDAKDKRNDAIVKLKKATDYAKKPKLESFLSITGMIGDEAGFIIGAEGHLLMTLGNLAAAPTK